MTTLDVRHDTHPTDPELADLLSGCLPKAARTRLEKHISSCDECMDSVVAAYESVGILYKGDLSQKRKGTFVKKINIYLILTILSFSLSFIAPRYFIQLLVATLLLGMKWVVDSKTTKMLVMIQEAWKKDGDRGVSRTLESFEKHRTNHL